jgi:hypothetical protein
MKMTLNIALSVMLVVGGSAAPALAKNHHHSVRYEHDGRYYNSYAACRASKRKHIRDGTIVGAAAAGIGAAVLGANLGETALIAGGGALVGNQLGRSKSC